MLIRDVTREMSSTCLDDEEESKLMTTDFLFYDGVNEIGCGKIKFNSVDKRLLEEDRARLGETLKRQLHRRIKNAKSEKEFQTFGAFIEGPHVELYKSTFSRQEGYEFILLCKIAFPTEKSTYTFMEESLEILYSFKVKQGFYFKNNVMNTNSIYTIGLNGINHC